MKPKVRPSAASENATGKPTSMKRIMPPNITGGITPCENILAIPPGSRRAVLLQRLFVMGVEVDVAEQRRDALDQLCHALQRQQREAERQQELDWPQDEAAGIRRGFADPVGAH